MVAVLDHIKSYSFGSFSFGSFSFGSSWFGTFTFGERVENWPKFGRRPEGITLSLHDQHRHADARQMRGAQLLRLAGRMQRIAECHDTTDAARVGVIGRRKMRCDAAAHRLASDEHRRSVEMVPGCDDRGAITGVEFLGAIRNATTLLGVEEVEREDVDAAFGQPSREVGDECALLSSASAVREHECRMRRRALRCIHKASSLSVDANVNRQVRRHATKVVLARASPAN